MSLPDQNPSKKPDAWWRSVLRDVAYALRNQDDLSREQIAEAIDRALSEGVPDWP